MICTRDGEGIITEGVTFAVGQRVMAIDSDYAGLKGCITEIRTGPDKETENETNDIYCCFDIPEGEEERRLLEEHFSDLFNEKKTIDDISLDLVIMAPEELRGLGADE